MKRIKPILAGFVLALVTLFTTGTASADLVSDSRRALQQLVAQNPAAAKAKSKAIAILVFPDVVKAGFIVGAQGGQVGGEPGRRDVWARPLRVPQLALERRTANQPWREPPESLARGMLPKRLAGNPRELPIVSHTKRNAFGCGSGDTCNQG